MRAWLLVFIVLATLLTLVQVASTENSVAPLSSRSPPVATLSSFEKLSNTRNIFPIESATAFPSIEEHSEKWIKLVVNTAKEKVNSVVPSEINNNQLIVNKPNQHIVEMSSNNIYRHPFVIKNKRSNDSLSLFEKLGKFPMNKFLIKSSHISQVRHHKKWIIEKKKQRQHRRHFHKKILKASFKESAKIKTNIYAGLNNNHLDMSLIKHTSIAKRTTPESFEKLDHENVEQTTHTSSVSRLDNSSSVIDFRISKDNKHDKSIKGGKKVFSGTKLSHNKYDKHLEKEKEKSELNPNVQNEIKKSLLSLLKMDRPPVIDRSKIVIPKIMTQLYARKKYFDWNYVARSFTHKRK